MAVIVGMVFPFIGTGSALANPTPAPAAFFGSNIQALIRVGFVKQPGWAGYLGTASRNGITIQRFDAQWNLAEPTAPVAGVHTYNWASLDQIATSIAASGARWFPVLTLPPSWAKGSGTSMDASHYGDYAAFAAAFTARYGSGGSFWAANSGLPYLPIQQMEVWTEANSSLFWQSTPNPAAYLDVVRMVRPAVHAVDPSVAVLLSLGWQNFQAYLESIYAAGGKGQVDGIGFHPYAPTAAGVITLTRQIRDITVKYGEPDLPIYMTEIGWPESQTLPGPARAFDGPVSDAARAATTALTGDALAASDCNVKDYLYYSLVEEQKNPLNNEDWLGLLNANGSPTKTFTAFAGSATRWSAATAIRSGKSPMLKLCSGPSDAAARGSNTLPPNGQLPVDLSVPMPVKKKQCFTITARYYGNPLEDTSVFVRQYDGRRKGVVTNAYGGGSVCMKAKPRKQPMLVWGRVGALASSRLLYCSKNRCEPARCTQPKLKVKKQGGRTLRVAVQCGRYRLFHEPIKVMLGRKGKRAYKQFFTKTGYKKIKVPQNASVVRVRFGGDIAFKFKVKTRRVRL